MCRNACPNVKSPDLRFLAGGNGKQESAGIPTHVEWGLRHSGFNAGFYLSIIQQTHNNHTYIKAIFKFITNNGIRTHNNYRCRSTFVGCG